VPDTPRVSSIDRIRIAVKARAVVRHLQERGFVSLNSANAGYGGLTVVGPSGRDYTIRTGATSEECLYSGRIELSSAPHHPLTAHGRERLASAFADFDRESEEVGRLVGVRWGELVAEHQPKQQASGLGW
jgi:hypothetical protein